jgi:hypothetical protein
MYLPPVIEHRDGRLGLLPTELPPLHSDHRQRLIALGARVRHDLEILVYPKDPWVLPRLDESGQHVFDVVIVGGGQCGLSTAFGLIRERVTNILVLDAAPRYKEGPWVTYSRMWTLRSPKHLTGPDLGIPSLAPRSWFEAMFGEDGWERLEKWPRHTWQSYLNWYRDVLALPVRNEARVTLLEQHGAIVRVDLANNEFVLARKVVLATGLEGIGDWNVPEVVRSSLQKTSWSLCSDDVDSLAWRGKRVAVLGAGATAWDRAADLLELGTSSLTLYMRRAQVLTANPFRYLEMAGYLRHYQSMDDADKWRWIRTILSFGQPPTQDGVDRCAAFDNFSLHTGVSWTSLKETEAGIEVTATDGTVELFDHLFIGCGFSMEPSNRPELGRFSDNILTWGEVYPAPAEYPDPWLASYPYLDSSLRFRERTAGATPIFANVFCFNYGTLVSNAHSGASLSGILYGIQPLIHGVTYALWQEDEPVHFAKTLAWDSLDTDPAALAKRLRRPSL